MKTSLGIATKKTQNQVPDDTLVERGCGRRLLDLLGWVRTHVTEGKRHFLRVYLSFFEGLGTPFFGGFEGKPMGNS